ncbi:hypothetical protein Emag_002310 [Eimeria magna]
MQQLSFAATTLNHPQSNTEPSSSSSSSSSGSSSTRDTACDCSSMLNSPQQHEAPLAAFTASGSFLGAPQEARFPPVNSLSAVGASGAVQQQQPQQLLQLLPTESDPAAASTGIAGASPAGGAATQAPAAAATAAAVIPAAAATAAAAAIPAAAAATPTTAASFQGVGLLTPEVSFVPEAFPPWLPNIAAAQADSSENNSSNKSSSSPRISKAKRPSPRAAGSSSSRNSSSSVRPAKRQANAVSCSYLGEGVSLQQQPLQQQPLQQQQIMQQQQQQQLLLLQGSTQASMGLAGLPLLQQQQQLQQQQLQQQYVLQQEVLIQQQRQQQLLLPDGCLPFTCSPLGGLGGAMPALTSQGGPSPLQAGPPLLTHSSGRLGGLSNPAACMLPAAASSAASPAPSNRHGRSSKSSKSKGSTSNSTSKAFLSSSSCKKGGPLEPCRGPASASAHAGLPGPLLPSVGSGLVVAGASVGPPPVMVAPTGGPPTQLPFAGSPLLGAPSVAPVIVGGPSARGAPSGPVEGGEGAPAEATARQCYYHPVKGEWRARYLISGKKRMKSFSLRKHPNDVALALAEMFLVYVHLRGVPASDALVKSWHHCVMALSRAAAAALAAGGNSSSGRTWRPAAAAAAAGDSSSISKGCSAAAKQQGSSVLLLPCEQEAHPPAPTWALKGHAGRSQAAPNARGPPLPARDWGSVGEGETMIEGGVGAPDEPHWLELLRACRVHAWVAKGSAAYVPATGVWDFDAEPPLGSEGPHLQGKALQGGPQLVEEGLVAPSHENTTVGSGQPPRGPHFAATGAPLLLHTPLQQHQQQQQQQNQLQDLAATTAASAVAAGEAPLNAFDFSVASGSMAASSGFYGGASLMGSAEGASQKPHQLSPLGPPCQQQGLIPLMSQGVAPGAAGLRGASAAGRKRASAQRGSLNSKRQLQQQQRLLQQQQQQQHYELHQQQQEEVSHLVREYPLQSSSQEGLFGGQYIEEGALQQQQQQQQEQQLLLLPLQPAVDFPEAAPTQQKLLEGKRCVSCGARAAAAGASSSCCSRCGRRVPPLSLLRGRLSDFTLLCRSVGVRGAAFGVAAATAAAAEAAAAAAAATGGPRDVYALKHQGLLGNCWFTQLQQLQHQQRQPQQLAGVEASLLQLLAYEECCKPETEKCAGALVVTKGPLDAKGGILPQEGSPELKGLLPSLYETLDPQSAATATLLTWRPALHTPRASCLQPRWACSSNSKCSSSSCSTLNSCCSSATAAIAADAQQATSFLGCTKREAPAVEQQPLGSLIKEEEDSASSTQDAAELRACKATTAAAAAAVTATAAAKKGGDSSDDELKKITAVSTHSEARKPAAAPIAAAAAAAAAAEKGPTEQTVCGMLRHWRFLEARAAAARQQLQAVAHSISSKEAAAQILHVALHLCRKAAVDSIRASPVSAAAVSQQQTDCSAAVAGAFTKERADEETQQQQQQQQQRGAAVVAARLSAFIESLKAAASNKSKGLPLTKADVLNASLDLSQRIAAAAEASQEDSHSSSNSSSSKCDVAVGPVHAVLAECDAAESRLQRLQEETDELLLQQEALVASLAADIGLMEAVADTVVSPQEAETLKDLLTGRLHIRELDSIEAVSREQEPVEAAAAAPVLFAASLNAAAAAPAAAEAQSDSEKTQRLEAHPSSNEASIPQGGGPYIARRVAGAPGSSVGPAICAFDFSLQQRISKVQLFVRGPHEAFWCARYGEGDSCVRAFSVRNLGFEEALLRAVRLRLAATGHPLGKGVGDRVVPLQQQEKPHSLTLVQQQDQQQQQQHLLLNQVPQQQQLLLQQYQQQQLLQGELSAAHHEYAAATICRPLQLQPGQQQQQQHGQQQQQQQLSGWDSPQLLSFAGGGVPLAVSRNAGVPRDSSWSSTPEGPPMCAPLDSAPPEGPLDVGSFNAVKHAMTLGPPCSAAEEGIPFNCEQERGPCYDSSVECVEYAGDAGGSGVTWRSGSEPSRLTLKGPSGASPAGIPMRAGASCRRGPSFGRYASSRYVAWAHQGLAGGNVFVRQAASSSRSEAARYLGRRWGPLRGHPVATASPVRVHAPTRRWRGGLLCPPEERTGRSPVRKSKWSFKEKLEPPQRRRQGSSRLLRAA